MDANPRPTNVAPPDRGRALALAHGSAVAAVYFAVLATKITEAAEKVAR